MRSKTAALLLVWAVGLTACATTGKGGAPVRQVDQALPAPPELPEGSPERAALAAAQAQEAKGALAAAQAQEAKGDAGGAAHEQARAAWTAAADRYAELAGRGAAAPWRMPLRQRAAELYVRAQRWEKGAEAAQEIVADANASETSRAVGARLAATAWLGAANAAARAGQVEKLDLGPERKDGPRPPAAPWKRFLDAADAYLARAEADPELRRAPADWRPSAAELALVAAEVQYAHGELDDARRRLELALERWPADPDLLEQAIPIYLATFVVRGDRAGHAAAIERLRERIDAEAGKAPDKKEALSKVLEALDRARAGSRFAAGEDLLREGKPGEAARSFEAAAEHGAAEAANALHNAGVAWDQAGEPAKAAAVRERLLREHPGAAVTGEDALRLAAFRARQGDHLGAAGLYQEFLERWPSSPSRCLALRNVASELDRAEHAAEAAARYLAFGKDQGCARADPNIAVRALLRAARLSEGLAKEAYAAAVAMEGVTEDEAKAQVAEAKRRLKGM